METFEQLSDDYGRIEQAILYLETHYRRQPDLKEVADSISLSEYHFQRLFTHWVGISPKRFLQYLTKENAKQMLASSASLLDVTYETGLSSPGRLHDLFVKCEAVTPGEYKTGGEGLAISYGFHPSPFGECLVAVTGRGICHLAFVEHADRAAAVEALHKTWPSSDLRQDAGRTRPLVDQIFARRPAGANSSLTLLLHGTNFQIKVWEALLRIPAGSVTSYEGLARFIGRPEAVRAVANAVANNPIAYLIPCHRVLRKSGEMGGYRYGTARKRALLGWEMAQAGK